MKRLVDLSQPLTTGMPFFPGHPDVEFSLTAAEPPRQIMRLHLGTHSGTHIDAPRHFVPEGATVDEYPLERFVVPAVVIPVAASDHKEITRADLTGVSSALLGRAVLFHTGWDCHWGGEAMLRHPYLGVEACEQLIAWGIVLVGTDACNIDSSTRRGTEAHQILLGHDVLVVENLTNLARLTPYEPTECTFMPLKLVGADGSPVRAYAEIEE